MKEGRLFIVEYPSVPENHFSVVSTDKNINTGEVIPEMGEMDLKYYSVGNLADELIGMGIMRSEMQRGKNVLLFVKPGTRPSFPLSEDDSEE